MPNWCSNKIVLEGKAIELMNFDKQFKAPTEIVEGNTGYILKSEFKPGEDWIDYKTEVFSNDILQVHYIKNIAVKEGYSFNNFVPLTKENFLNNWYKWSIKNWGTKWDCGDDVIVTGLDEIEEAIKKNTPNKELILKYNFDTAWEPCTPLVAEMARQYPSLSISHFYFEDGLLIAGVYRYKDGVLIENEQIDEENFREFVHKEFDEEFLKCLYCNKLVYDWELEEPELENNTCPFCGSDKLDFV